MIDLIPPEGATQEQLDAFVESLREDAREHVRELFAAGASELEIAEYMASFEPAETEPVSLDGGER